MIAPDQQDPGPERPATDGPAPGPPAAIGGRPALELAAVSATRGSGRSWAIVVEDLSLAVAPGELVALMGPSGSGKTSVIHLACGLLEPDRGEVRIDGSPMARGDGAGWARSRRRSLGVVHQRLDLLPGLSVLDNVAVPLLLDGTSARAAHEQARIALGRVGGDALADRPLDELSGGEQHRVAVARAVVGPRQLILADEPTAALDTVAAEAVVELLASLAATGVAVLLATHDSRLASWADRVVYLRDGRSVGDAPSSSPPLPRLLHPPPPPPTTPPTPPAPAGGSGPRLDQGDR